MLPNNLTDKEYAAYRDSGCSSWADYTSWESISRKIRSGEIKMPQKKNRKRTKWKADGLNPYFIIESRPGPDAGPKQSLFHVHPGVLVLRLRYRGSELRDEFGYGHSRFCTFTKKFTKVQKKAGRDIVYPFEVPLFLLKVRLNKMPKEQRIRIAERYWKATEHLRMSKNIRALRAVLGKYIGSNRRCSPETTLPVWPINMLF